MTRPLPPSPRVHSRFPHRRQNFANPGCDAPQSRHVRVMCIARWPPPLLKISSRATTTMTTMMMNRASMVGGTPWARSSITGTCGVNANRSHDTEMLASHPRRVHYKYRPILPHDTIFRPVPLTQAQRILLLNLARRGLLEKLSGREGEGGGKDGATEVARAARTSHDLNDVDADSG